MRGIIAAVMMLCSLLEASTIRWYGTFDAALEASRSSGKPMFVVLVERGCGECRQLFVSALRRERIVRLVNGKTIPVIVTKENEDYPIELLYTLEYPAIFLLSPREVLLKPPVTGAVDAALLEEKIFDEL
ncbi:hypothetical protein NNO_0551 [Hydrogenimonas sp.]|nr:hypothetical protein NNO_0551 [Hydrogenimonas sp.]